MATPTVRRFSGNPLIRPEMLPPGDGDNINGPSLIRVPRFVTEPLGRYYLYFAHHHGSYIRMAFADRLEGPWRIRRPGALDLEAVPDCQWHVASPDVVVDEDNQRFRMYFHGPALNDGRQLTFVAESNDGIRFYAAGGPLCPFYFRAFRWEGWWYGVSKGGLLFRSEDGLTEFEEGHNLLPECRGRKDGPTYNGPGPRHVAVLVDGPTLWIYYTRIGDAPERIARCRMALSGDWSTWQASEAEDVLKPEQDYEGAALPLTPSAAGAASGPENALRDPFVFQEDGRTYLFYSVAGESGLAAAELSEV